jgi:Glucose / Sorbosone dehydrogenase
LSLVRSLSRLEYSQRKRVDAATQLPELFIVQQGGQIRILNLITGTLNPTPFLTVSNITTAGEEGLLGLAFDPDYATNGKFYVDCVAPGGAFGAGITQIRQYQVSSNPDIADATPSNIKTMLSFDQPQTNHNGESRDRVPHRRTQWQLHYGFQIRGRIVHSWECDRYRDRRRKRPDD